MRAEMRCLSAGNEGAALFIVQQFLGHFTPPNLKFQVKKAKTALKGQSVLKVSDLGRTPLAVPGTGQHPPRLVPRWVRAATGPTALAPARMPLRVALGPGRPSYRPTPSHMPLRVVTGHIMMCWPANIKGSCCARP